MTQSSSSRASKELEKARAELEEERQARRRGSEDLSRLEGEVAELRSAKKRVEVRVESGALKRSSRGSEEL